MKDNKDNAGKIILSLLVGATAGAVAGLLLAPETGGETRANLKKSAAKLGDDVNKLLQKGQESIDQAKTSAAGLVEQGKAAANDALASLSAEAQGLAGKATDLANQATEQAKKVADDVTNKAQSLAGTATEKAQDVADTVSDTAQTAADAVTGKAQAAAAEEKEDAKEIAAHTKSVANHTGSPQPTPKVDPIKHQARENANDTSSQS